MTQNAMALLPETCICVILPMSTYISTVCSLLFPSKLGKFGDLEQNTLCVKNNIFVLANNSFSIMPYQTHAVLGGHSQ